jgi:hypothetical protein
MKLMEHIRTALMVAGILQVTACSTPSPAARTARFTEEQSADFIARYYSDHTSYALKPAMMDGAYQAICDRDLLLKVARQQPRHELAVVVLIHYPGAATEEPVKLAWVNDLQRLGYRRIVFLRGDNKLQVNGLPILEPPQVPVAIAGK